MHRAYHNLTARYNGYYYATESIKEGVDKITNSYKFDYDKYLPVFLVPTNLNAKNTFPEFDKAIKKSSNCIQRHTIKDKNGSEISTAGKWIDNNWNVIGISHFYKREFFPGIEAFDYVIRSYKSTDKYKALIFLARSYLEIGSPTQAEAIIGILKDDKNISKYAKKELPAVEADYYMKRGKYKDAESRLLDALKGIEHETKSKFRITNRVFNSRPPKKTRARYSFILGQIYEEQNQNKKAIQYYQKTMSLKPDYELIFNARIKLALLFDIKNSNVEKLKRDLLKMTLDIKNTEYLDVIYYTLGGIFEKEKNESQAIVNYKLSVKNSTQNPKQKALSYLKLGDLNFENTNYTLAGAYYDSTMISLPKEYKDYAKISKRKTTLETLVGYIKTIQREDSLQRIAKMNDLDRDKFITKLIAQIEAEEERLREEKEAKEAAALNNNNTSTNVIPKIEDGKKGDWYFYNPTTIAFGINDFVKKFGTRKLEDNWRRSQKSLTIENTEESKDTAIVDREKNKLKSKQKNKKSKEIYLIGLPLNDSLLKISNAKIIDSYYNLGIIYKEDLENNKKSIASYEELNKRYAEHKYRPSSYYQLYNIFVSIKNKVQADYYKNKLYTEFPDCEYTQILKNPNYAVDKINKKDEVEIFYTETYHQYSTNNFRQAYNLCKESEIKFGKNDYSARFGFIKALCVGKLIGPDSLEYELKKLQVFYPKDSIAKSVKEILEVINNLKQNSNKNIKSNTDTLMLDLNAEHYVIAIYPDDIKLENDFKAALTDFNNNFYGISNLSVSSSLFGSAEQILYIKTFKNSEEALRYIQNLKQDRSVFNEKIKPDQFSLFAISINNLPILFRKKTTSYYIPFYSDHYK
ncbi:MAG: tetratricopeptide repeat protein [Bacteroidota bacterium]